MLNIMERRTGSTPTFTDSEITAAFLVALNDFRGRNGHGKPLTQEAVTSMLGLTPGSMSQWKKRTNVRASTLVSAFVGLGLTLALREFRIGVCNQEAPAQPSSGGGGPEQMSLFIEYGLADEPAQTPYSRQIELDQTRDVVLRLSVRKALAPTDSSKRQSA